MEIKVEGQPCSNNCGGKYVKNPKTNKIFCENKCWLNGILYMLGDSAVNINKSHC